MAEGTGPHCARSRSRSRSRSGLKEDSQAVPPATVASAAEGERQGPGPHLVGLSALLLGLERRPDRRKRCKEMLAKELPWLQFAFFRASDGKSDEIPTEEVALTWNTKHNARYGAYEDITDKEGKVLHSVEEFSHPGVEYKFSPGERGCAHSHYRMWKCAAEADRPTLILEDDVELIFERTNGEQMMSGAIFTDKLELAMQEATKKDADVLYLSWAGHRGGNYKYHESGEDDANPIMRRAEYVWTTVAYVIWPQGAQKLLDQAKPVNQPVDNFMGWECAQGRLHSYVVLDDGDDDETWAGGIAAQMDFTGDSDIKKSDGGDQGDDPTEYLASKGA